MSRNEKIVIEFLDKLSEFDFEAMEDLVHEDCVYKNVPFHVARGKKRVIGDLKNMMRRVNRFEVEMVHMSEKDDAVLTERIDTIAGRLFSVDIDLMGVFVVKDEKIIEWRDYFDWSSSAGRLFKGFFKR